MKTDIELTLLWRQTGDVAARNTLVLRYMPAVYKQAMKYPVNHLVRRYDLIQEGVIGLIRAVDKYDITKSTKFWTCAYYHVMDLMYEYSMKHKPTAGGWVVMDRAGDDEQAALIDAMTAQQLTHILETECTKREQISVMYKHSGFTSSKEGLHDTQIKRAYESAIKHIKGVVNV